MQSSLSPDKQVRQSIDDLKEAHSLVMAGKYELAVHLTEAIIRDTPERIIKQANPRLQSEFHDRASGVLLNVILLKGNADQQAGSSKADSISLKGANNHE